MSMRKKGVDGPQDPRQRRDEAAPMTTTPIPADRCQSLGYHHRHSTPRKAAALQVRPPNDDVVSPNDSPRDRHRRCRLPATAAAVAAQQNDRHMDSPAAFSPKPGCLGLSGNGNGNRSSNNGDNLPAAFLDWFQWPCDIGKQENGAFTMDDLWLSSSLQVEWGIKASSQVKKESKTSPQDTVIGQAEQGLDIPARHRALTEETAEPSSGSSNQDESEANEKHPPYTNSSDTMYHGNDVPAWSAWWTRRVLSTHGPILYTLQCLSGLAARFPHHTIALTTLLSFGLLLTGLVTNFNLNVGKQFSLRNSVTERHGDFIREHFTGKFRPLAILLHGGLDGDDDDDTIVLGTGLVERAFRIIDVVTSVPGYRQLCRDEDITYINPMTGEIDCEVYAVTRFWANNQTLFEQSTEQQVVQTLSGSFFPDGTPVSRDHLYGTKGQPSATGTLSKIRSSLVVVFLPSASGTRQVEHSAVAALLRLRQQWRDEGSPILIEVQSSGSLNDEFTRAIAADIPLVPVVFGIMSLFTAVAFARWHAVHSRALLGIGAVVMVMLSIAAGFGTMFTWGTPFSNLTQIIPFIIFGVGLDDAFILIGAYERTANDKETTERIRDTIDDIGLSITLTTLTSAAAFALGCQSSVLAVVWLCSYAVPLILLVFLYTLTFFVALIVIDEERIQSGRMDCCVCFKRKAHQASKKVVYESPNEGHAIADRITVWYANMLLLPITRAIVIIGFGTLFVTCAISASKLTEEFSFKDALPRDSYVIDFTEASSKTASSGLLEPYIYFRSVDLESAEIRAQMRNYLADLAGSSYFTGPPRLFWLDFFEMNAVSVPDMNFTQQMDHFLSNELYSYLFARDISRDENGSVVASRVRMRMNVDSEDAIDQIAAMKAQEVISKSQPINAERQSDLAFFCHDGLFKLWEFLRIAKRELISTTIVSVFAVTLVAFVFIPHWSAIVIVFPLVCVLFVDLLGVLQWAGLHINPVSYVSLAMSIGLLVDYIIHIVVRYFEENGNRREKTVSMLRTMGFSILLGGTTTWLGTIPLMFSSSDVFETVYVTFLGIVLLGMGHALILLPVLLSLFGPETHVSKLVAKERQRIDHIQPNLFA